MQNKAGTQLIQATETADGRWEPLASRQTSNEPVFCPGAFDRAYTLLFTMGYLAAYRFWFGKPLHHWAEGVAHTICQRLHCSW